MPCLNWLSSFAFYPEPILLGHRPFRLAQHRLHVFFGIRAPIKAEFPVNPSPLPHDSPGPTQPDRLRDVGVAGLVQKELANGDGARTGSRSGIESRPMLGDPHLLSQGYRANQCRADPSGRYFKESFAISRRKGTSSHSEIILKFALAPGMGLPL